MKHGHNKNAVMTCKQPRPEDIACKEKAHGDECSVGSVKGECYLSNSTNRMYCKLPSTYQRPCVDKEIGDSCVYKGWKYGGICGKDSSSKKYLRCHQVYQGT